MPTQNLIQKLKQEFNRPLPNKYDWIIDEAKNDGLEEPFVDFSYPHIFMFLYNLKDDPQMVDRFKEKIKGKDFLDLGCGFPQFLSDSEFAKYQAKHFGWDAPVKNFPQRKGISYTSTAEFARDFGARRYIGVDLFLTEDVFEGHTQRQGNFDRIYLGGTDILEFLSTIPSADQHPTNKFLFFHGLDGSRKNFRYFESLHREVNRITKSGDCYYSDSTDPNSKLYLLPLKHKKLMKMGFELKEGIYVRK